MKLEQTASVLKLLGDKTRLAIVRLLDAGECCVCELVEIFQMSQPAVSQHLRKLRDVGIVKEKRKGTWVFYSLNREHEAYGLIASIMRHVPDQKDKLLELEKSGRRIQC